MPEKYFTVAELAQLAKDAQTRVAAAELASQNAEIARADAQLTGGDTGQAELHAVRLDRELRMAYRERDVWREAHRQLRDGETAAVIDPRDAA